MIVDHAYLVSTEHDFRQQSPTRWHQACSVVDSDSRESILVSYFGSAFELDPTDTVDSQGFANQLEGIWVLAEHQALLLRGYLAQPHYAPQQPFNLAHPVAYHLDLHMMGKHLEAVSATVPVCCAEPCDMCRFASGTSVTLMLFSIRGTSYQGQHAYERERAMAHKHSQLTQNYQDRTLSTVTDAYGAPSNPGHARYTSSASL